jgi:uncharacterized protein
MRTPVYRHLDPSECEAVLKRQHVGRLAFVASNRVDIEPIHYVFRDGWIFGRTSEGTKVKALEHRPWVAFEVDEVDTPFDWRSVVVHGTIHFLPNDGSPIEREEFARAVDELRRVAPQVLTPNDPAPHRTLVFGLYIDSMTGRAAEHTMPAR